MSAKLYIGNISYDMTEDDLIELFSDVGEVVSAKIIRKMESGFSRGFGFVEMRSESSALLAIERIDGRDVEGRTIRVSDATPNAIKEHPPEIA